MVIKKLFLNVDIFINVEVVFLIFSFLLLFNLKEILFDFFR